MPASFAKSGWTARRLDGLTDGSSVSCERAEVYDSPVLVMRERTRRLKSLLVVIGELRSFGQATADAPQQRRPRRQSLMRNRSEDLLPFASQGPSLGEDRRGWAGTVATSTMPHGHRARKPAH